MPDTVQNMRLLVRKGNLNCPMHINGEAEFVIVKKGCLYAVVDCETRKVREGECTVIFPYRLHEFRVEDGTHAYVIMFPQISINEFCGAYAGMTPDKGVFMLSDYCLNYIYSVLPKVENSDNPILIQSVFAPLAAEYLENTDFSAAPQKTNSLLQNIVDYLYLHMGESVRMRTLCADFGICSETVNRLFREGLHLGPSEFLNNIRIERACTYLQQGGRNITETAYLCGYGSLRTFNRAFRKAMNCTPTEFCRSRG